MNIALIGYGKMGKAIHEIAKQRGHEAVLIIDADNLHDLTPENIKKADVVIEFTSPHTAFKNVTFCLQQSVPVVCGSTGWLDKLDEAKAIAEAARTGLIVASNFSVGVNIFFEVNKRLAQLMATQDSYDVTLKEIHHTAKKDAPSGTALAIGNSIAKAIRIIEEGLSTALDRVDGGPLAENLGALYDYCVRKLISANAQNDDAMLQEVMRLIEPIATGWNEIKKNAMSPQVAVPAMSGKPVLMEA